MTANQGPKQAREQSARATAADATADGTVAETASESAAAESTSADAAAEADALVAANGSASAKAPAPLQPSDAGEPPAREPDDPGADGARWRRRFVLVAVAVVAVVAGVIGSWAYNIGFASRAADNSAIMRSGADPSTFLNPTSDRHSVVLPVANNSPDAVTVVGAYIQADQSIKWNGDEISIPAGQTANVVMVTPDSCPVTVLPQLQPAQAEVYLRVTTVNGKPHGITLAYTGVVAYAVAECQIANAAAGIAP
ncbi:MAG TPA: hypothetical protein VGM10_17415 [Actinocrinis sp.]